MVDRQVRPQNGQVIQRRGGGGVRKFSTHRIVRGESMLYVQYKSEIIHRKGGGSGMEYSMQGEVS